MTSIGGTRRVSDLPSVDTNMLSDGTAGFRLHNGTSFGPLRTEWGSLASTRLTQGVVTVDLDVNKELFNQRADNTESRAEHERIGAARDPSDLNIEEHDALFITRSRAPGRGGSAFCFSSFNAINRVAYHTQDDFEDAILFIGRAKGPYVFNSPEQRDDGVACQVRGGFSFPYIAKYDAYVGDCLAWGAPSLDKRERAREQEELHKPEGYNPRKLPAIFRPLTYGQIHRMPQRAYAQYMTQARDVGDDAVRTRLANPRSQTRHASRLVRFAITCFRAGGLAAFFSGLAVCVEKGLVTLPDVVAADAQMRAAYTNTLNAAATQLTPQTTVAPDVAGRLLTFAYLLDLAEAAPRDAHVKPSGPLIADIIETQCRGLADPSVASSTRLAWSRWLKNAPAARGAPKLLAALDTMQLNAVLRQFSSFAETKRREDEKVIGVVTKNATPGGIVDVCR